MGDLIRFVVGVSVRIDVGDCVGLAVYVFGGSALGNWVRLELGMAVGMAIVRLAVGIILGMSVGDRVGMTVGLAA